MQKEFHQYKKNLKKYLLNRWVVLVITIKIRFNSDSDNQFHSRTAAYADMNSQKHILKYPMGKIGQEIRNFVFSG